MSENYYRFTGSHSPGIGVGYICLYEYLKVCSTKSIKNFNLDYDEWGRLIGVEVMNDNISLKEIGEVIKEYKRKQVRE